MSKFIAVIFNLSINKPKTVIFSWLLILLLTLPTALLLGAKFNTEYDLPDSQSKIAMKLISSNISRTQVSDLTMVFSSSKDLSENEELINQTISEALLIPGVESVSSPYQNSGSISPNKKVAISTVMLSKNNYDKETIISLQNLKISKDNINIYFMGEALKKTTGTKPGVSEMLAISAALLVLLITFGSVVAALMPIITAVLALGISTALIIFLSHNFPVAEFSPMLADLVGLGVGLDYALFIVSRFRKELINNSVQGSIATALKTSGRAVLFAGGIVCIALLGLFSVKVKFLYGVALSSSISVIITMLASLSFLPAMLMLLGRNINKLSIPKRIKKEENHLWHKWSLNISKRPRALAFLSLLVLTLLCLPTSTITLGSADASSDPVGSSSKMAFDTISGAFGKGYTAPLQLITVKSSSSDEVLRELILELKNDPAVASISQPLDSPNGKTTIAAVTLNFSPQERETNRFLNKIYDNLSKIRDSDKGEQIYVGGLTPILYDFSTSLTKKLPGFILVVVLLSSILLMILFRSILIPIKAALMNLISILASFGIVVISFQWGWLTPLLGIGSGPIEPFLPIILFAILFGLSMDYEVFLVSRIQEEWLLCKDNEKAVRMGLANTGGVITAAALIMIVVFTAFIFTGDRTIQLFGVGLASAILIDATIIRSVLVPALMQSFGDKNWYLPKWLGKILPPVQLEKLD